MKIKRTYIQPHVCAQLTATLDPRRLFPSRKDTSMGLPTSIRLLAAWNHDVKMFYKLKALVICEVSHETAKNPNSLNSYCWNVEFSYGSLKETFYYLNISSKSWKPETEIWWDSNGHVFSGQRFQILACGPRLVCNEVFTCSPSIGQSNIASLPIWGKAVLLKK